MRGLIAVAVVTLLGCPTKEDPAPAEVAPPPSAKSEPAREDALVLDVVWPPQHETVTISYVVIPGSHAPKTSDELWAIAKAERGARLRLASGEALREPVRFPDAKDGTACAVAKRDQEDVIGFDCTPIGSVSITLDPMRSR